MSNDRNVNTQDDYKYDYDDIQPSKIDKKARAKGVVVLAATTLFLLAMLIFRVFQS